MSGRTAEIKIRTTPALKDEAKAVYESWGITLSDAFNIFMRKSVEVGGIPFDVRPEKKVEVAGTSVLKPDPKTGLTVLPERTDSPEDDGLYDHLV